MFSFTFNNPDGFLVAFVPGLISIGLVIYILFSFPRNRLINIFTVVTLCAAVWQINDAVARICTTAEIADVWDCVLSAGWILAAPACLHFSLLYTKFAGEEISRWVLALIYIPAFVFMGLYQAHVYVHDFRWLEFWGWVNYHDTALVDIAMVYWISVLVLFSSTILVYYSYKVRKDALLRAQAVLITLGVVIPVITGLIAQVVFPIFLKRPAIPVASTSLIFLSLATVVALKRYKLFTILELISNELLLEELPVIAVSISTTGQLSYINKYGSEILGVSKYHLRYSRINELLKYADEEHKANFNAACENALKGRKSADIECSIVINGEVHHVLVSSSPVINNNMVQGALLCIRDITELRTSTQLIRQNEHLLKEAQKLSHLGSWEWDLETQEITWSDELFRIYGIEPADLTYEEISRFTHPEDAQYTADQIAQSIETLQPADFIFRILLPGNTVKYLNAKCEVTPDTTGKAKKLFGTVQDITKQIEAEISLQQKNLELQQTNANLEEFAYVASHDLREPLRKIIAFSGMIINTEKQALSENSKAYFSRMISAADRMQVMIEDILSLATISQNHIFENYSLQAVLNEVLQDLDMKIKEHGAVINADDLPVAHINPRQFRQLFFNLLNNSLKFSKKGILPVINIRCHILSNKEVNQLALLKGKAYLKIEFEDNGIGFENAYTDKIFQMFQRLHGKVDYEGTGIGLAICKKIVENHKGIITASGEPDKGATFTIIIPATVNYSSLYKYKDADTFAEK